MEKAENPYQANEDTKNANTEDLNAGKVYQSIDPLPEAGGVVWTDMLTKQGQKVNVTARATSLVRAIDELNQAILYAHETYGWNTVANVTQPARARRNSSPTPAQPAVAHPPSEAEPGGIGQSIITQYQVAKKPDGTGELLLYEAGHKYPDLRVANWSIENLTKFLEKVGSSSGKPWEQAITEGEQGMVHWLVTWQYSEKRNQKGNPYKDVKDIAPFTST